jgi:hypothetical protein
MDLTNEQWNMLEPRISELPKRADGRGRPWRSSREVLNGILWVRFVCSETVNTGEEQQRETSPVDN